MATPTAISHPETSAHHHGTNTPDITSDSSFRPSKPSYSPPSASSIYSRATGAFSKSATGGGGAGGAAAGMATSPPSGLRLPLGMSIGRGLPSPPQPKPSAGGDGYLGHARARSQTTTCALGTKPETFDDRLPVAQAPGFFDSAARSPTGSSRVSSCDLLVSRSPTSPSSASSANSANGAFQTTYSLGRVPSLPLGASYEQAQKRFNSGSWSQNRGWSFGSLRNGTSQAYAGKAGDDTGGAGGGVGGLLRRFSIGGGHHHPRLPEHRYSIGSAAELNASGASATPRAVNGGAQQTEAPAAPTSGHAARDSGVSFSDESEAPPKAQMVSPRGRQSSISGSSKRKPSPMGERLLMGHFNAH